MTELLPRAATSREDYHWFPLPRPEWNTSEGDLSSHVYVPKHNAQNIRTDKLYIQYLAPKILYGASGVFALFIIYEPAPSFVDYYVASVISNIFPSLPLTA